MSGPATSRGTGAAAPARGAASASRNPPELPARPPTSPFRLVTTLAGAGALAGLLLVFVFQATQPAIRRNKAAALERAVTEVLHGPARTETLYLRDGRLTREAPPGGPESAGDDRVFVGYDQSGRRVGFAMVHGEPGFQDVVRLIFGFDPETGEVLGMKVLDSKETPGLGDKIEKDPAFTTQFEGVRAPLSVVKGGADRARGEIDAITGATISSRAVVRIINDRLADIRPLLEAWIAEEVGT